MKRTCGATPACIFTLAVAMSMDACDKSMCTISNLRPAATKDTCSAQGLFRFYEKMSGKGESASEAHPEHDGSVAGPAAGHEHSKGWVAATGLREFLGAAPEVVADGDWRVVRVHHDASLLIGRIARWVGQVAVVVDNLAHI